MDIDAFANGCPVDTRNYSRTGVMLNAIFMAAGA